MAVNIHCDRPSEPGQPAVRRRMDGSLPTRTTLQPTDVTREVLGPILFMPAQVSLLAWCSRCQSMKGLDRTMSIATTVVARVSLAITRTALGVIAFVGIFFGPSTGVAQQVQGDWTPEPDFAVSGRWRVTNLEASCADEDLDCCDASAYGAYPFTNVFLVREGFADWSEITCRGYGCSGYVPWSQYGEAICTTECLAGDNGAWGVDP